MALRSLTSADRVTVAADLNDVPYLRIAEHPADGATHVIVASLDHLAAWRDAFNGYTTRQPVGEGCLTWTLHTTADGLTVRVHVTSLDIEHPVDPAPTPDLHAA